MNGSINNTQDRIQGKTWFKWVDIENEILDKKPQPHLAESKVLSISIITKNKQKRGRRPRFLLI